MLAAFVLAATLPCVRAESLPAAQSGNPSAQASHWAEQVVLGSSTVELTGPWKFHKGDNEDWARPDFNDSGWAAMDLTPPAGSIDPFLGIPGFVPGWTVLGAAGYSGYAWYRLKANVQYDSGLTEGGLELKMPDDVDDAYQVYVNGTLIGGLGRFSKSGVTSYLTLPRSYALPRDIRSGQVAIAIRVWMDPATPLSNPDTGGLHGPPVLGQAAPIERMLQLDWDAVNHSQISRFIEAGVLLLAITVAGVLFWLARKEKAYLWLGLTCVGILLQTVVGLIGNYTAWIPGALHLQISDALLSPAVIGLWVIFWAYWFRMGHMPRMHKMVWGFVAASALTVAMMRAPLYGRVIPVHAVAYLGPLAALLKLLLGAMLIWVAWEGMRKDHAGAWLAMPAVGLIALSLYQQELLVLHLPLSIFPFGYAVSISQIAVVVSLNIITVLLMRRFLRSLRLREQWEAEIDQARQVQQLLIPDAIPKIPGFALESEYRPAQQVGGDFFQILPDDAGGVLIVLGDVTGKGLQAGMQVALIVGAIRTIVETSFEPQLVLEALNRRLCNRSKRSQSYATCVALHIAADGKATIANAGHLAPYLNGKEMAMTGNLPLGLSEGIQFDQITIALKPRDRLLVLTDGVIEAKNAKNELFGFNRARSISHLPASFIVKAAEIFGQEDDITVLSIARLAQEKQGEVSSGEQLKSEVA
jgi:Stage II sporulation protein E (SpoIIE)/7TM diverse intracellular signalling